MMKKNIIIVILLFFIALSCDEPTMEKPENLIKKTEMIDMLVDIHLAEATYANSSEANGITSVNLYYSILEKYQVPDSVFEKSYIFYASTPKEFEKMYRQVMNELNEMHQEISGRNNDLLEFEREEND